MKERVLLKDLIPGRMYRVDLNGDPIKVKSNFIFKKRDGPAYVFVSPVSHIEIRTSGRFIKIFSC